MTVRARDDRPRVLYLAPWVDYGGSDKGTIDWFKWLDRSRFAASLVTTQPSHNRRLSEVAPYADEVWPLPDLMAGQHMPAFIFDCISTRGIEVLHIMNSRLAYQLLPDLSTLPRPPKVVVQLHVEEHDRSGYVRLVTRRYGNLVDAFSVTSEHLARAVEGYDVPRNKIHVIRTGVDAETEFAPHRARPVELVDQRMTNVLYPGRLVEQKDPLLMLDVATRAVEKRDDLRFHVVGDGPLEPEVRRVVADRGLDRAVVVHPPTRDLASWYSAADVLLMTSVFEGVPYVVYEAMAMGLPVVAPALAGNVELLRDGGGVLVDPRDDAQSYAAALVELAEDQRHRAQLGQKSRARALGELSVRTMAREHEELYDALLSGGARAPASLALAAPHRGRPLVRPRNGSRLVSVIVPCFNHGRYLDECLRAIAEQDWPEVEVFVVDDASTDDDTLAALAEVERGGEVEVIHMPRNGGPSRARNAALERVRGRYVLPVDADNILLPQAIRDLVGQLEDAADDVALIYPNPQYFGNRRDYYESSSFNLQSLLDGNICDTCSLFDAQIFNDGLRFADDIELGHEDWDLALEIAERGYRGEPARGRTVLYRKSGFTRSDVVEHAKVHFADEVRARHPALFGTDGERGRTGAHSGPAATIKARWSPALSILALGEIELDTPASARLWDGVASQTATDFELLSRSDRAWPELSAGPLIRRMPPALSAMPAAALQDAWVEARGPFVLVTAGDASDLLSDPAFVEKVLRAVVARPPIQAIAFCDCGDAGRYAFRLLGADESIERPVHTLLLRRDGGVNRFPELVAVRERAPIDYLVRSLVTRDGIEWRHLPGRAPSPNSATRRTLDLRLPLARTGAQRHEREERMRRPAALPSLRGDTVRRWQLSASWMPPETLPLVRHRRDGSEERIVTNDRTPPAGYSVEFDLGCVHRFQPPGCAELRASGPEGYAALPDEDEGAPVLRGERDADCLGFIDPLQIGFHPPSGRWTLVCGANDPLHGAVEQARTLGYVEAFPNHPRPGPIPHRPYGLVTLVRTVDRVARKHRYGVGPTPPGAVSLALGLLHTEPQAGSIPLWLAGDVVMTEASSARPTATAAGMLRWAAAPVTWRDVGPLAPRVRAAARRALDAGVFVGRRARRASVTSLGVPIGYLWPTPAPQRAPIYMAIHPVTGDQLLSRWPMEITDMGYRAPQLLGWASVDSSVPDLFAPKTVDVPWASRFGRRVRYQ
jgi:glycosyltransferase involved in cell wall biosynthesis